MKGNKRRWWLPFVLILASVVLLTACFWSNIIGIIIPKVILSPALANLVSQLDIRYQNSPLPTLISIYSPEGRYAANMQLQTENKLLGAIICDLNVRSDIEAHRLSASGTIGTPAQKFKLSLYLDDQFAAVSSEDLIGDSFYGITYDTFADDIRQIPLLRLTIKDSLLSDWDNSLQNIQDQMQQMRHIPIPQAIPQESLKKLILGIAALPCEIEDASLTLDGVSTDCQKLAFHISRDQIDKLEIEGIKDILGDVADITASFYLYQKEIVRIDFLCESPDTDWQCVLECSLSGELLDLHWSQNTNNNLSSFSLTVNAEDNGATETWRLSSSSGLDLTAVWEPSHRETTLYFASSPEITATLGETEEGILLKTDDFYGMTAQLLQIDLTESPKKVSCTAQIQKGSAIETPQYKNLDQWSLVDFFALLNGIGSLIGIHIE